MSTAAAFIPFIFTFQLMAFRLVCVCVCVCVCVNEVLVEFGCKAWHVQGGVRGRVEGSSGAAPRGPNRGR